MVYHDPSDNGRKAALKTWLSRLASVQEAVSALQTASSDLLLIGQSKQSIPDSDALSFDKLCMKLDNRTSDLEHAVSGIRRAAATVGKIRNASSLLIPCHRLPNEILRSIFVYASQTQIPFFESMPQKTLSSVCSLWRDICNSTPVFWNRITFGEGHPFDRTHLYLNRTGGSCLNVDLDFLRPKSALRVLADSALPLVLSHFPRWHSFKYLGPTFYFENIVHTVRHSSDRMALKQLSITGDFMEGSWLEESAFHPEEKEFWSSFAHLCRLTISHAKFPWSLPVLRNLTEIKLDHVSCPSVDHFRNMLKNCPTLRKLSLGTLRTADTHTDVGIPTAEPSKSEERNELNALTELSLLHVPEHILQVFFTSTRAPNLVSLTFDAVAEAVTRDIARFLMQSPGSLTHLHIHRWNEGMDEDGEVDVEHEIKLPQVLRCTPNLLSLRFHGGTIRPEILRCLAPMQAEDNCMCEGLESLMFVGVTCSMLAVTAVLQSRHDHEEIPQLKAVLVETCYPCGEEIGVPVGIYFTLGRVVHDLAEEVHEWDWCLP